MFLQDCQDLEHHVKVARAFELSQREAKPDSSMTFVQYVDQSRGTPVRDVGKDGSHDPTKKPAPKHTAKGKSCIMIVTQAIGSKGCVIIVGSGSLRQKLSLGNVPAGPFKRTGKDYTKSPVTRSSPRKRKAPPTFEIVPTTLQPFLTVHSVLAFLAQISITGPLKPLSVLSLVTHSDYAT